MPEMPEPSSRGEPLHPVELVVLQGTSLCNLNCSYCDLSAASRRSNSRMDSKLIERLFSELFASGRLAPQVTVVWHSGEPLTLPPSYYDQAIDLILGLKSALVGDRISVKFDIQTNGVLIDESWCELFERHRDSLAVGISCDGPAELHDSYRRSWSDRPTHSRTTQGMNLLQQHGIKYKVIAVVSNKTLSQADAFFQFFQERSEHLSGFHFNILAQAGANDPGLRYSAEDRGRYYAFYRRLLELSRRAEEPVGGLKIQNFSQALARIVASQAPDAPSYLEETSAPLKALNVDARGNVTTFYAGLSVEVLPELYGDGKGLCLGNIFEISLEEMVRSAKLERIRRDFEVSTRSCKASCEYFRVCSGGFELTKKQTLGTFEACETDECVIHVKTLVDAVLDDLGEHLAREAETLPGAAS